MKMMKRVACAALACAMVFSLSAPVFADAAVTKDETIFVTLSPSGSVDKETVSVWLHSDNGLRNLADQSNLQNLTDLHGEVTPRMEGGYLYWDTDEADIYYQGDSSASLPITVDLTYKMDGVEMSAEDITGKSGHFSMTVHLTNNRCTIQDVGGTNRTIYKPYVCAVGAMLNTDDFKNIRSDHGTQNTDSGNTAVAYVLLPGMAKSFEGLLTGNLSDLADKLFDSVTLEADVENLKIPSLYIACASSAEDLIDLESDDPDDESLDDLFDDMDDLRDATNDLLDGTRELFDGTGDLYDAVFGDLTDGTNELKDGTKELRDKVTGELSDGVDDLHDGAKKLNDGAKDLYDGAGKLSTGADSLYSNLLKVNVALSTLSSKSSALLGGGASVVDTLFASATDQLNAALKDLGYTVPTLTHANYAAELDKLTKNIQGAALSTITAKVQEEVTKQVTAQVESQSSVIEAAVTAAAEEKVTAQVRAKVEEQVKAVWASTHESAIPEEVLKAMTDAMMASDAVKAQIADAMASDEIKATMAQAVAAKKQELIEQNVASQMSSDDVKKIISDKLNELAPQLKELNDTIAKLYQVGKFYDSLATYTKGVDTLAASGPALVDGSKQLKDGAGDLKSGAKKLVNGTDDLKDGVNKMYDKMPDLKDGVVKLDDGVSDLVDGVGDLRDGANDLRDGAKELDDGMNEYNDEGISKLTDNEDMDKIQDLYDVAKAIKDKAQEPSDFTGTIKNADISTKFVMRTTVPEAAESTEAVVEEAPKSFFQKFVERFKNLFGLD